MSAEERHQRYLHESMSVSRKSICMLELQLRTRLWLDSSLLIEPEKRAIIALVRNGLHTADIITIDAILGALKQPGMRLRVESQRPQMPTRLHEAGECSWEHYHMWELLRDITIWEKEHSQLILVDEDGIDDPDDDPEYVDLESEPKPEPVTRRGKQSRYVALTQKNADALYWVAEFTPNGGITSSALAKQLGGIGQSGARTRISKLMEVGLVTYAPGKKEMFVVTDFWYEAEVVVA